MEEDDILITEEENFPTGLDLIIDAPVSPDINSGSGGSGGGLLDINCMYDLARLTYKYQLVNHLYYNDLEIWPVKPTEYADFRTASTTELNRWKRSLADAFLNIESLTDNNTLEVWPSSLVHYPTLFAILHPGEWNQEIVPLYPGIYLTFNAHERICLYGFNNKLNKESEPFKCSRFNRGDLTKKSDTTFNSNIYAFQIHCSRYYTVSGNIASLSHPDWYLDNSVDNIDWHNMENYAFDSLFYREDTLVSALQLKIFIKSTDYHYTGIDDTLARQNSCGYRCCAKMFYECYSLEYGPYIEFIFDDRTSDTLYIPILACAEMFQGCANLKELSLITNRPDNKIDRKGSSGLRAFRNMLQGCLAPNLIIHTDWAPDNIPCPPYVSSTDFPSNINWQTF